jgi:hypothetical protein
MSSSDEYRTQERYSFCLQVVRRAEQIRNGCIKDKSFRACFEKTSGSQIRENLNAKESPSIRDLHATLKSLDSTLYGTKKERSENPTFCLVFDEVASLLGRDGNNGRYIALNRVISCISDNHYIWYFFLSTETRINDILPSDLDPRNQSAPNRPSFRVGSSSGDVQRLERFPPFSSFAVDIKDLQNKFKHNPKEESMQHFATERHMATFGRPLWSAYSNPLEIALVKLFGGQEKFNVEDPNHIFAVLSVRLFLDFNIANPKTLPLAQNAVNLHMRLVNWMDPSTGNISTTTPSEPILSLAAMGSLQGKWSEVINAFTAEFLDRWFIDKGSEGELYARLIFTLARDSTLHLPTDSKKLIFTVEDFLQNLYTPSFHGRLAGIDKEVRDAKMNFLSFSATKELLPDETLCSFQSLRYLLLRRNAALQLAPLQPSFDLLMPFYMGSCSEPFDPEKTGAILIQIKNRKRASNIGSILESSILRNEPRVKKHTRSGEIKKSKSTTAKYLFLLLDLGIDKPSMAVSHDKETVWSIHSQGYDGRVFGCLKKMNVENEMKRFFVSETAHPSEPDITVDHHRDQLFNAIHHDKII